MGKPQQYRLPEWDSVEKHTLFWLLTFPGHWESFTFYHRESLASLTAKIVKLNQEVNGENA